MKLNLLIPLSTRLLPWNLFQPSTPEAASPLVGHEQVTGRRAKRQRIKRQAGANSGLRCGRLEIARDMEIQRLSAESRYSTQA
jgi:hypothetical protein